MGQDRPFNRNAGPGAAPTPQEQGDRPRYIFLKDPVSLENKKARIEQAFFFRNCLCFLPAHRPV